MTTADKLGLLPGFGWISGHGFFMTLVLCWLCTPILHCLIGLIGESRWVPLDSDRQFLSFFPGDLFLGAAAAGLLALANKLPERTHWFQNWWVHSIILGGALIVAFVMTRSEWKNGAYPPRAILSPTKLYHNFLLYGGYGYVIVSTLLALIVMYDWSWTFAGLFVAALVPGFIWLGLVVVDSTAGRDVAPTKGSYAHIPNWKPIWSS